MTFSLMSNKLLIVSNQLRLAINKVFWKFSRIVKDKHHFRRSVVTIFYADTYQLFPKVSILWNNIRLKSHVTAKQLDKHGINYSADYFRLCERCVYIILYSALTLQYYATNATKYCKTFRLTCQSHVGCKSLIFAGSIPLQ